jgi:hypothetical protein
MRLYLCYALVLLLSKTAKLKVENLVGTASRLSPNRYRALRWKSFGIYGTCGLYYKNFTIIFYDCNANGMYYKTTILANLTMISANLTMIVANLALASSVN